MSDSYDIGLVGRGAVGSALMLQRDFDAVIHSKNASEFAGSSFDTLYCAAGSAKKWLANKNPEDDKQHIDSLIKTLRSLTFQRLVLISTVDVFDELTDVNENVVPYQSPKNAYGRNRFVLEENMRKYCFDIGANINIIRLGGLVGPTITKNILFDLAHDVSITVNPQSTFQYYDLTVLEDDIRFVIDLDIKIKHLAGVPMNVQDIVSLGGKDWYKLTSFSHDVPLSYYDVKSNIDKLYAHDAAETISLIRKYDQYVRAR